MFIVILIIMVSIIKRWKIIEIDLNVHENISVGIKSKVDDLVFKMDIFLKVDGRYGLTVYF